MLDNKKPDIASIDQHLSQQGHFCLIDWLLSQNHLHYVDYEAWRHGQLTSLEEALPFDLATLNTILDNTNTHCETLGLHSEPLSFYRWDTGQQTLLAASKHSARHQQLTQNWLRPQDVPQLDLFMDNSALITENALRDALSSRQFDRAEQLLQQLIEINHEHQHLGAYQDLTNYGKHMLSNSPAVIDAEMSGLMQEVLPLAQEILGSQARDYLAFAWRRLADSLQGSDFNPDTPQLHRSFALAQIPDWRAAQQCLSEEPSLYSHPLLIERLAEAYDALKLTAKAQLLWCLLLEQHSDYAEQAIEQQRNQSIYPLWEDFWDFDNIWPSHYFSAYVLARQPRLIQHLDDFIPLESQASQAMIQLLRCHLAKEDEIAARGQLQAISPALLRMYMEWVA